MEGAPIANILWGERSPYFVADPSQLLPLQAPISCPKFWKTSTSWEGELRMPCHEKASWGCHGDQRCPHWLHVALITDRENVPQIEGGPFNKRCVLEMCTASSDYPSPPPPHTHHCCLVYPAPALATLIGPTRPVCHATPIWQPCQYRQWKHHWCCCTTALQDCLCTSFPFLSATLLPP